MSYNEKTNEELVFELKKLQLEHNTLKEEYKKDIAKHKQHEETLAKSELFHSSIYDSIEDLLFLLEVEADECYRFNSVNNAYCKVTGLSEEMVVGKLMSEVIPEHSLSIVKRKHRQAIKEGSTIRWEDTFDYPKGQLVGDISITPVFDGEGSCTHLIGSVHVITERKQAEEMFLKSEHILKRILDNFPGVVFWKDRQSNYLGCNQFFATVAGLKSTTEIVGKTDLEMPWASTEAINYIKDDMAVIESGKGRLHIIETQHQIDGQVIWLETNKLPLIDSSGEIIGVIGVSNDISELKKAEQELINTNRELVFQNEEKEKQAAELIITKQTYLDVFNTVSEAIYVQDETGTFIDINKGAEKMYGYTREELIGKNPLLVSAPGLNDIDEVQKISAKVFKSGVSARFDFWAVRKNGEIFPKEVIINKGRYFGKDVLIVTARDITLIKRTEKELIIAKERAEESENKYRQIFDNTFDIMSIYEVTEDGRFKVITFNAAEAKLIGNVENYQNRYIDDCIPPELYNQFKQNYDRSILAEKLIEYEEDISFQDINKTFHTQLIPLKNGEGRIYRIIVISRDITETKLLNTQLTNQNEKLKLLNIDLTISKQKAEESDRLKSAFLANMSHEIRTPMNGILGFSELLKNTKLSGEQQTKYIEIIEKSGKRMLKIINDIVDISKIEAGLIKIYIEESNINEQIEDIYTFFKPEVEAKGMQLFFNNELQAEEATIKTDREKLFAILTNLVKNAIKYSNEGTIEFGYKKKGGYLEFFLKDTGVGIPKDRQEAIFERFIKVDIEDRMAMQGAGLGLAISKAYVEILGGKIWVESEEGIGTTFYFTLPYNTESSKKNSTKEIEVTSTIENQVKNLKILIAEDDEASEMLLSLNVSEFSKEIIKAKTGREAIEAFRDNPDIDLVLMDIQMPGLNGYEAARHIRQFNKDVVIIAQTAFGLAGDREKSLDAGCNDYISKPIKFDHLVELIKKYFNK